MTKNIVFCLLFSFSLLGHIGSAAAFDTPVTDQPGKTLLQKTANSMKGYAQKFGCDDFIWGNIAGGGTVVTVQFLPKDLPDQAQWQRMVSISLYGVTGDKVADAPVIEKIVTGFERQAKKTGEVIADKLYRAKAGDETMFLEYTVNKNSPDRLDVASVFMPVSDRSYALIQLNARMIPIKPDEEQTMHQLVNPAAGDPPKAAAGKK